MNEPSSNEYIELVMWMNLVLNGYIEQALSMNLAINACTEPNHKHLINMCIIYINAYSCNYNIHDDSWTTTADMYQIF